MHARSNRPQNKGTGFLPGVSITPAHRQCIMYQKRATIMEVQQLCHFGMALQKLLPRAFQRFCSCCIQWTVIVTTCPPSQAIDLQFKTRRLRILYVQTPTVMHERGLHRSPAPLPPGRLPVQRTVCSPGWQKAQPHHMSQACGAENL